MTTSDNISAHEWIGLRITITKASDPAQQGLDGIVRDETMNTFTLETKEKLVQIQKHGTTFSANLPNETVQVDTSQLRYRPEDRVKKGLRKW